MKYLITGGAGSLGRALVARLKSEASDITIFSRDEGKHALHFNSSDEVNTVIGDVRDYQKILTTIKRYNPDVVIHAAALKRVDDMELYPDECIKTNIQGSENIARASLMSDVGKCILVSTDKACQPVNVYGSSKFIAERIFTNYDYSSKSTIFSSVRYGNVIASRGSFIPLWLRLLKGGKRINVTSLEMTRFLFTLSDAVETVLASATSSEGGEVFVPRIKSYEMSTILNAVEQIHNAPFDYDIIGLRPGEKLHEDMLSKTELPYTYEVPNNNILAIRPQYTNRTHSIEWEKYLGPEFNSKLHTNKDAYELASLILRGTSEA